MHANELDSMDHLALQVADVPAALEWYTKTFHCELLYRDDTWALLRFANIRLALVTEGQHPPHLAFEREEADAFGPLKTHRDGTRSAYIQDPSGNAVEILAVRDFVTKAI
jgi:catechol 2,3-dioxygenase-like lactoylglutathione lyase family enzyme